VARLQATPSSSGDCGFSETRTSIRRHFGRPGRFVSGALSSNLAQRILTAVVVLPLAIAAIVIFPRGGPFGLAALLCLAGMIEAHTLLSRASHEASWVSFFPGLALFLEMSGGPGSVSGLTIAAVVIAAFFAVLRADRRTIPLLASEAAGAVCGLLIGLGAGSFSALATLAPIEQGTARLALLLSVVIACDVCAYFVGRAVGRHKLAPQVSPAKTIEGAIGGLLGAAIASAMVATQLFKDRSLIFVISIGVVVAAAGIVGDLLESLFKRYVGAKDSGTLFPGHGGALYRMDAFILAAPVLYAFFWTVS
jgi:phosphatidate cytidylyltransferase